MQEPRLIELEIATVRTIQERASVFLSRAFPFLTIAVLQLSYGFKSLLGSGIINEAKATLCNFNQNVIGDHSAGAFINCFNYYSRLVPMQPFLESPFLAHMTMASGMIFTILGVVDTTSWWRERKFLQEYVQGINPAGER